MKYHLQPPEALPVTGFQIRRQFHAAKENFTCTGRQQSGDDSGQACFTAAGFTHNGNRPLTIDLQVDVVDDRFRCCITGRYVLYFQDDFPLILWYVFFFPEGSDSQQLLGVFLFRGLQNIPGITDFYKISVSQDHNAIGQLGNNGQIVADVYRRGILLPNDVFYGRQDFDLCGDIQCGRRFIKYDDIRLLGHRHCHHGSLELATGNLVRVPIPDPLRIRKVEAAVEIDRLFLRFGKRHQAVLNRAFRKLVDEPVRRIKCGRSALGHIGNAPAPQFSFAFLGGIQHLNVVKNDGTGRNATTRSGITQDGKTDG